MSGSPTSRASPSHETGAPIRDRRHTDTRQPSQHLSRSVLLLGRRALVLAPQDLSLLVLDGLVNLCAARGLVAVHLGREGGVVRARDLLLRLLLAAAVCRVVLVLGLREAVGYAALVLWVWGEEGQLDS